MYSNKLYSILTFFGLKIKILYVVYFKKVNIFRDSLFRKNPSLAENGNIVEDVIHMISLIFGK